MNPIWVVAGKELKDGMRNRWILAITLIFAMLSVAITWFGSAATGTVGFSSLPATITSLASLVVFLIPLIALLLSYDAIVGEDEAGTLLLLLSYPLTKRHILFGKFLGHGAILSIAILFGFGVAALVVAWVAGTGSLMAVFSAFGLFIFSSVLLGLVFIALAYAVSALVTEKSRAAGLALIFWFVFVLIYDMGLLGMLVATEGKMSGNLFPYLLLLNPTDVFRLLNLVGLDAVKESMGILSLGVEFSLPELVGAMLLWVGAPLCLAQYVFQRRAL